MNAQSTPTPVPVPAVAALIAAGRAAYAGRRYGHVADAPAAPVRYAIDVRAGRRGGRKFGIWRVIWLKPAGPDGSVVTARRAEWIFVGEADAQYTGPGTKYAEMMARAEQLLAQVNAAAGEVCSG